MTRIIDDQGILPCCWADCERAASTSHEVRQIERVGAHSEFDQGVGLFLRVPAHQKVVIYAFCSERHKMLYVNSPREHNRLPVGSRGLIS